MTSPAQSFPTIRDPRAPRRVHRSTLLVILLLIGGSLLFVGMLTVRFHALKGRASEAMTAARHELKLIAEAERRYFNVRKEYATYEALIAQGHLPREHSRENLTHHYQLTMFYVGKRDGSGGYPAESYVIVASPRPGLFGHLRSFSICSLHFQFRSSPPGWACPWDATSTDLGNEDPCAWE